MCCYCGGLCCHAIPFSWFSFICVCDSISMSTKDSFFLQMFCWVLQVAVVFPRNLSRGKKRSVQLVFLQAERSHILTLTGRFAGYSIVSCHSTSSLSEKAQTGDGGSFSVTARSGGLFCFCSVSLAKCFYRHIIAFSVQRNLSVCVVEGKFFIFLSQMG